MNKEPGYGLCVKKLFLLLDFDHCIYLCNNSEAGFTYMNIVLDQRLLDKPVISVSQLSAE